MPTRSEMNRAVAAARLEFEEQARIAMRRAHRMRKAGLIDDLGVDEMIRNANRPQGLDPVQFPNAGRLKHSA